MNEEFHTLNLSEVRKLTKVWQEIW